jgi:hypothetical protein
MKLTALCLFVGLTAGAQSTTEHLPVTDAEKLADALRAAPNFITDEATIVDYAASKGGDFRVLRKGTSEWTCLPGPPPGSKHDDPGCFDRVYVKLPAGLPWNPLAHIRVTTPSRSKISRVSPAAGGTAPTSLICRAPIRPINGFWLYQFSRPTSSEGGCDRRSKRGFAC